MKVDTSDYDSSQYDYTAYWKPREYEDKAETLALTKILPSSGESILDAGGGFGRHIPLYSKRFTRCVLLDLSQAQLDKARVSLRSANIGNVTCVQGDAYNLPMKKESFELKTKDGEPYDIPPEGSLGLLALGAKGLIAWRNKRDSKIPE